MTDSGMVAAMSRRFSKDLDSKYYINIDMAPSG